MYPGSLDVENVKKPLSHASLIKAYIEGKYPYGTKSVLSTKKNKTTSVKSVKQLSLFDELV